MFFLQTKRAIPGATVFYPSDGVSTERAVEHAANTKGICFIRTSRPNTPVIYSNDEQFEIGKAKIVLHAEGDIATIVAGGVTLHEALKAAKSIKEKHGKSISVIDLYTVKPLDWKTILETAKKTNNRIITVEDHYLEGGIGEAVSAALLENAPGADLRIKKLYVKGIPMSGQPEELLARFEIDAKAIQKAVESF